MNPSDIKSRPTRLATIRKSFAALLFVSLAAAVLAACSSSNDNDSKTGTLVYQSVSGDVGQKALNDAFLTPFTDDTGIKTKIDFFCCDNSKLRSQVETNTVKWDITTLGSGSDFFLAQEKGLLQKLDYSIIDKDKLQPDAAKEYGIQGRTFAATIAWNTDKYPLSGTHPTTTLDIFNTSDFPGKRCMYKYADFGGTLEISLMASGVERNSVYPMDLDRAFSQLDKIKKDIIWWESGEQVENLLRQGECDIAITWHSSAKKLAEDSKLPFDMAWGDPVLYHDYLGIPKNAKHAKEANELINWIISHRDNEVEFVKAYPYPLLGLKGVETSDYGTESAKFMPVGDNIKDALVPDAEYIAANAAKLSERMSAWQATK